MLVAKRRTAWQDQRSGSVPVPAIGGAASAPRDNRREGAPMSRLSRLGFIDTRHTMDPVRRRVRSRGVPTALQDHEVFYSEDPREASELVGKALAGNRLTVGGI